MQAATGSAGTQELLCAELERRGWVNEVSAEVRTAGLAPVADQDADVSRIRLTREPDEEWLGRYGKVRDPELARRMLVEGPSVWFASLDGGRAIGRCVVDGRWAGFGAVTVGPEHRRRGLATAVMAALARRALEEGASAAWLQVETDNPAARALYDGMGFATHHAYHHFRAGAGA